MLMLSAFMSLLHASLYLSCGQPVLLCPEVKLSIEDIFWNSAIPHMADMAKPAQPMLSQQGVHGGEASLRLDVSIGHLVLP